MIPGLTQDDGSKKLKLKVHPLSSEAISEQKIMSRIRKGRKRNIFFKRSSDITTLDWEKLKSAEHTNPRLRVLSIYIPSFLSNKMSFVLSFQTQIDAFTTAAECSQMKAGLEGLLAYNEARMAAIAAAPAAVAVEKPKKKATKAKAKEDPLLAPVDLPLAAPVASPVAPLAPVDPSDPLKSHPSRLQTVDASKCMARKIAIGKWVPGTHKDEGGTKKFHPEGQCSSKPAAGNALCAKCQEQEALAAAGKRDAKKWFGRLDQPLYEFAAVVGCKQYLECYPQGIKGDPLSVPPLTPTAAAAAPGAKASVAPVAKAPVAPGAPKKAKKAKEATEVPTAIAMTELAPVEAEWVTFIMPGGVPAIRNLKTHMVYGVNAQETDRAKMAQMENCLGRWVAETASVDPYGVPDEE
jgi:hypothetical protein